MYNVLSYAWQRCHSPAARQGPTRGLRGDNKLSLYSFTDFIVSAVPLKFLQETLCVSLTRGFSELTVPLETWRSE